MARSDKYTTTQKQQEFYSDFFPNLTPHPDTGELVRLTNEDAVKRSIRNLVMTNKYERLRNPSIKSNVRKTLFENISPQSATSLASHIKETITNNEPRAKLIDVLVAANEDQHMYTVSIIFYVEAIGNPTTLNINLYRVR